MRYPGNADEIADLWEFFADPGFSVDAAVKGLNITGKPDEEIQRGPDRVLTTYPKQSDLVGNVQIDAHNGDVDGLSVDYERPFAVSFGRLDYLFGEPKNYGGPVGFLSPLSALAFQAANRGPNSPSVPYYMHFRFEARHALPDGRLVKGSIELSADGPYETGSGGTRNVQSVGYFKETSGFADA